MSHEPAVGIDLGTTFSVIAFLDPKGAPQTILNMEGDLTTPSVAYFEDEDVVVGKEAVKAATYEPEAVAQFAKRDIGKTMHGRAIRGAQLPPEVIQAAILKKLKHDAEMKLGQVHKVVVTVPAFFNEPRRKATMDAGRLAGLEILDIINEPTAAAIAYGVQAGFLSPAGQAQQKETILVYDLGGGTFDVTLMEIDGQQYTAIATDGDVLLGGVDWDQRLLDHLAEAFQKQHGVDPRTDPANHQVLLREAEDAKRALTSRDSVTIRCSIDGKRMQHTVTRQELEQLTSDLVQRTLFTVEKLLRDAKRQWSDLTRILLVGGSTRMPMIAKTLEEASGMKPDRTLSPDEAVAHGAALYAGFLQSGGSPMQKNMAVKNVNSHDLGVLAIEKATGMNRRRMMIPRNTLLPARGRSRFTIHRAGQKKIIVNVIEGGDDSGKNSTAIGKCVVSDLPDNLSAGANVVVEFIYLRNGRLNVKASLPDTGHQAGMVIERASGMSEEDLQLWTQRIANNEYLADAAPAPAPAPAPAADPSKTAINPVPLADDFDDPAMFDEDEDSEIFSDLDF